MAKVGPEHIWVATHNSKVVGFVGLIVEGSEAEIEPLIVSKNYRGRGIGKQLTETVVSEARRMELRFLNVAPVARNMDVMKFFYEQGFRNLGNIQLFICFTDYPWKSGPEIFGCKFKF